MYTWVINPYAGCAFACSYCYARFIKKFTGHTEPWGGFVDVKVNAAELAGKEAARKKKDTVWISGICDPYQPLEETYGLTRGCIEALARNGWPFVIQTKSPGVLRDLDILKQAKGCEAGFSIGTADESIRKIFEPAATPIESRIESLAELHASGIRTYAMIAPVLPGAENLMEKLEGKVDYVYVDRMNYTYAAGLYRKHGLEAFLTAEYFARAGERIKSACGSMGVACSILF